MENIISEILEIDEKAREKLAEADSERNKIIADARAEEARMLEESLKSAEARVAEIEKEEAEKTKLRLIELDAERDAEIKRLDRIFEERKEEWEEKIFQLLLEDST